MKTLKDFYGRIEEVRDVRVTMVQSYLDTGKVSGSQIDELKKLVTELESIEQKEGKYQLLLDETRSVDLDLDYEIDETKKDIVFFEQGEAAFEQYLAELHQGFEAHVAKGVALLGGRRYNNFVTDRDGTISNYCGRYRSSVQSAYNAIYLTRFSRARAGSATIVTSAPLLNPGVATVSVMPVGAYIYAASKAREFIDKEGQRRTFPIDPEQQAKLDALNKRLAELCEQPDYEKFTLIGSGLQFKFGETTLARQDISRAIPEGESQALLGVVEGIMKEVDPTGKDFGMIDMGLDIEVILKGASEGEFSKADGLFFLNQELGLGLETGPTLMCGDTKGDLPLLKACLDKCADTYAMFATKDENLTKQIQAMCKQSLVVPEVDMLVTILDRIARD